MKHQKKKHRKVTVSHISSTFTYFVESLLYSFQFIKYNIIVIAVELNSYSVWQKSQNGLITFYRIKISKLENYHTIQ